MAKEKYTYRETYKKPYLRFLRDKFPVAKHLTEGSVIVDAALMAAGRVEVDGKDLEYHDIRIFIDQK